MRAEMKGRADWQREMVLIVRTTRRRRTGAGVVGCTSPFRTRV